MGSKFVEKHKRKSALAALLLFFQGRSKYVAILLVVTVLSLPFVVSGEMVGRLLAFQPVAAALRAVGLGGVLTSLDPAYSNDMLKAALDKAAADSAQNSYWARFLKSINATLPPGGGPSSIAMLRGSADEIFGPVVIKDPKGGKPGPNQVKGAVSSEDVANGQGADGVDLQGLLAGGPGAGNYGDQDGVFGRRLPGDMGAYSGAGAYSGSGPYMNRMMMRGPGGAFGDRGAGGFYGAAMNSSGGKVPVPGAPQKVRTKTMGRVSGFSWKNVGYKTSHAMVNNKLGSKKPMFQLAETYAMTNAAFASKQSALEYQSAYTGTTYDGNDSNLELAQTGMDTTPVAMPDTSFIDSSISDTTGMQETAKECTDTQGREGARMSAIGREMDDITNNMGSAPRCYDGGGRSRWNAKVNNLNQLCKEFNVNKAVVAQKCQTEMEPMSCKMYTSYTSSGGMLIKSCPKPSKWLKWVLAFALAIIAVVAVVMGAFLVAMIAFAALAYVMMSGGGEEGGGGGEQIKDKALSDKEQKADFKE